MKNLNRISKIAILAITMLFFYNTNYAQISVSNGGTYYVCIGEATTFSVTPTYGDYIANPAAWWWPRIDSSCSTPPCNYGGFIVNSISSELYPACTNSSTTYNEAVVTLTAANTIEVSVQESPCQSQPKNAITFTIVPYTTSVSGGITFCESSNETYTATTNVPGVGTNDYGWQLPTFLSGNSTTYQINTTTGAAGTGNVIITVSGGGCPYGSVSNKGIQGVTSLPTTLPAPVSFLYVQDGSSCWWNGSVVNISGATEYEWSKNSAFTDLYGTSLTSTSTGGYYTIQDHTYTVYVRATNECTTGASSEFTDETPNKPPHCIEGPVKPDTKKVVTIDNYSVYPNPASNHLTIEYPSNPDNSVLSISLYDMLGQGIVKWSLPTNTNSVSENIAELYNGVYLYVVNSGDKIVTRGKLIIQR